MLTAFHLSPISEAGTDEAGRGCLAGPVTCAAVILSTNKTKRKTKNANTLSRLLDDSKKLSEKTRDLLRPIIEESAISFAVIHIDPETIDKINILNASIFGMQKAVLNLSIAPKHLIVDGNRFNSGLHFDDSNIIRFRKKNDFDIFDEDPQDIVPIPYTTIIKGDSKYMSIAAASVLAKTYRDAYMLKIHKEFPMYHWDKNKGYPTKDHREAIAKYGITPYHRKSFKMLKS